MPYFLDESNGCSDQHCSIAKPHTHLEVMLNPLGVTGRMNVGQLYETTLGWIAKHTAGSEGITVEPFSKEWSWDRIQTVMTEKGLSPKQKLFYHKDDVEHEIGADPSSGQITVGYQYMMKLSHLAGKKITSRSQKDHEYDIAMGQPIIPKAPAAQMQHIWKNRETRKRKAQRLGEMEIWALQGHSAWNIIDELFFLKSDAERDRSHFVRYIEGMENGWEELASPQREHRALKTLVHYCRGLGLEIEAVDKDSRHTEIVGPSSWPQLKGLAIRIANDQERKDWAQANEIKNPGNEEDGLWSKEIFGDSNDPDDQKVKDAYGFVRLPVPIDNPIFSELFRQVLTKEKRIILGAKELYDFLKGVDWKNVIAEVKKDSNLFTLINKIIQHGYTHDDFFIRNLLVLPKGLRAEMEDVSNVKYLGYRNDLNYLYEKIIETIREVSSKFQAQKENPSDIELLRRYVHALLVNGKISPLSYGLPLIKKGLGDPYNSILATVAGYRASKTGIIRMHLLGKRVDFSGRAVIVPDPDLRLNEAGIPYVMAKTLFEPMIIQRYLSAQPKSENPSDAEINKAVAFFINDKGSESTIRHWLYDILRDNFIILNRAPSLHRLSILSFKPCLRDQGVVISPGPPAYKDPNADLDGDVIRLNPYVCKAFNADFDGDTMSVHVPMLPGSKIEAEGMLPSKCLRSPASGELLISQKVDIGLGCYFLKSDDISSWLDLKHASGISQKDDGPVTADVLHGYLEGSYINNGSRFEEGLESLTEKIRPVLNGHGITIGLDDFSVTPETKDVITRAKESIYENVATPSGIDVSRHNHDELDNIKRKLSELPAEVLPPTSSLRDLIHSRSMRIDLMQLVGMRSYQSRPGGEEVSCPILSNIFEGLSPLEYFNSCHGARYGLADKGLSTAVAGELTNILVQAVQDVFITEDDCGTERGLYLSHFVDADAGRIPLKDRIINRCLAEDIAISNELIEKGTIIDDPKTAELISINKNWIKIRSPIFCEGKEGVCKKCYGYDLSTGKPPLDGYPAGIVASQSIGEPGTQLALKTFHGGGAAGSGIGVGIRAARKIFSATYKERVPGHTITTPSKTPNNMSWFVIDDQDPNKLPQYPALNDPEGSAAKEIFRVYGKNAAAEYLLFALQRVYNSSATIRDHHFEIVIRKMLSRGVIRGIVAVGNQDPGFLAKLSFRQLPKVLMEAAIAKATDELNGLKEKTIAGQKIVK